MKRFLMIASCLTALAVQAQVPEENYYTDIYPDTWVATDGVGRKTPTAEDVELKTDKPRSVGIFYITWHTQNLHNGHPYKADVSKVLEQDPNASRNNDSPAWTIGSYHWGEPEYGYFLSQDEYVIRHDLSMLADAGVDVLILDVTNAVRYWDEWEVLFRTMETMKAEGNKVPKFCFWAFNGQVISVVQSLYERYYKEPKYQDLWFYWGDKPLLLYNATPTLDANPNGGQHDVADYSEEVKSFFTLRNMWWGYDKWGGKRYIGTEDNWSFGQELNDEDVAAYTPKERTATHNGRLEEYSVTPAQHPISIVGKSWSIRTKEPELDEKDMPKKAYVPFLQKECENPTQYGIYFQERWDEALEVDPDFIYLNDWNEWTAGKYRNGKDPSGQADLNIDFLGRKGNPFYFVDQYNAEFNRTIAPMKGGYTDNYYMQMVENIRRYKGVRQIPENTGMRKIKVDGQFQDWNADGVAYRDTRNDVTHRDHNGYGDFHYTNNSGRNDIVLSRVAVDKKNIFFYAETANPLTKHTDSNWMLLFIDIDQDASTGWDGYDYLINKKVLGESQTTLMRYDMSSQQWQDAGTLEYAVNQNQMEIAIPRYMLQLKGNALTFDFKWADNPADLNSVISLCTDGDTAPNRRFNYRFIWKKK